MLSSATFVLAAATLLRSASAQTTNTSSEVFNATAYVKGNFGVTGVFNFLSPPGVEEISVSLSIDGLDVLDPTSNFIYHIHTNPVAPDGNCSNTLAHLDPLNVGEQLACDPDQPQFCQLGDLSGRNGVLPGNVTSPLAVTYQDPFLRFFPQPFSLLGRSITVHFPNKTRIACGNITSVLDGTADADGVATNISSNYVTTYAAAAPPTPANAINLAPFVGDMTNTTALALATIPASLPNVNVAPNVVLGQSTTLTTIAGSAITTAFPIAVVQTSSVILSGGAEATAFPQQSITVTNPVSEATATATSTGKSSGNGSSTASVASSSVTGSSTTSGSGSLRVAGSGVLGVGIAMLRLAFA